jgi:large subunit ribosomal protein L28
MAPLKESNMAKKCEVTGKKTQIGGRYSNRTRATQFNPCGKTRRQPNLQKRRIFVPELDKHVTVNISTKALRTIAKNGAYQTLKEAKLI